MGHIPHGGPPYAGFPAEALHKEKECTLRVDMNLYSPRFLASWPAISLVASQLANKTIGDNWVFMIYWESKTKGEFFVLFLL